MKLCLSTMQVSAEQRPASGGVICYRLFGKSFFTQNPFDRKWVKITQKWLDQKWVKQLEKSGMSIKL